MEELVFEVAQGADGGYYAEVIGRSIFTQGDDWRDLRRMALEVTQLSFDGSNQKPSGIRLHHHREELMVVTPTRPGDITCAAEKQLEDGGTPERSNSDPVP
jgi:hypothetical protein